MKRILTLLLLAVTLQMALAQDSGFFFNIHTPASLHNSYIWGQYSTIALGSTWGWDGTIGAPVIGEMVYAPDEGGTGLHILCDSTTVVDYTGKIVLIDRGTCTFSLKARTAQNLGAIGVIIRNNVDSLITMGAAQEAGQVTIPIIMVPLSLGQTFIDEMAGGNAVVASFANEPINLARVEGKVTFDDNENCIADVSEPSLGGWQIKATNGSDTHFAYTKADGSYRIYTLLGTSVISVQPPAAFWEPCNNDVSLFFSQYDSATVDFQVKALQECPQMSVDIEVPFLRRCFDNYFDVHYCNLGSATAEAASITVHFDDLLEIGASTLPYTDLGDNTYEFQIGDLSVGQCGLIEITASISCDADFGQTLCAVAEAFPNAPCVPTGSNWSGAEVRISSDCIPGSVVYKIENTGNGDMTGPLQYSIFKDGLFQESGPFQLDAGETMTFGFDADGSTYRMEAPQEPAHPNQSLPASTMEGCTVNGTFSTGFFNIFPAADYGDPYDEECMEVIGSFDPNDKTGFPFGYGPEHFIERGTDLQYLIRFQNTGTDTAFNIVIRDTMTALLDLNTLRPGVSSHPYELAIVDGNVLKFSFNNIMLPDSNVNEPGSHGYLNFSIAQQPTLPLGSLITNKAGIYFDFNAPVITNETWHEVGENFIPTALTHIFRPGLEVRISPNPMSSTTIFDIGEATFSQGKLDIYDASGKLIRVETFDSPRFELSRRGLPSGNFIFKISIDGQAAAAGSLLLID